jgi:hypothetical protein
MGEARRRYVHQIPVGHLLPIFALGSLMPTHTPTPRTHHCVKQQAQEAPAPTTTASQTIAAIVSVNTSATPVPAESPGQPASTGTPTETPSTPTAPKQPYRPPANHPWRRFAFGRTLPIQAIFTERKILTPTQGKQIW